MKMMHLILLASRVATLGSALVIRSPSPPSAAPAVKADPQVYWDTKLETAENKKKFLSTFRAPMNERPTMNGQPVSWSINGIDVIDGIAQRSWAGVEIYLQDGGILSTLRTVLREQEVAETLALREFADKYSQLQFAPGSYTDFQGKPISKPYDKPEALWRMELYKAGSLDFAQSSVAQSMWKDLRPWRYQSFDVPNQQAYDVIIAEMSTSTQRAALYNDKYLQGKKWMQGCFKNFVEQTQFKQQAEFLEKELVCIRAPTQQEIDEWKNLKKQTEVETHYKNKYSQGMEWMRVFLPSSFVKKSFEHTAQILERELACIREPKATEIAEWNELKETTEVRCGNLHQETEAQLMNPAADGQLPAVNQEKEEQKQQVDSDEFLSCQGDSEHADQQVDQSLTAGDVNTPVNDEVDFDKDLRSQKTSKRAQAGENLRYASVALKGTRPTMEDADVAVLDLGDGNSLFGVFDGHGGRGVASKVAEEIKKVLTDKQDYKDGDYKKALEDTFLALDEASRSVQGSVYMGTTASVVLVTKDTVFSANAGDSRAVAMLKREAKALSEDHKPENESEEARVIAAGGFQMFNRVYNCPAPVTDEDFEDQLSRTWFVPSIATSRAVGDFMFKSNTGKPREEQMLISKPDVKEFPRADIQFVLVACDGLWDIYTTEATVFKVRDDVYKGGFAFGKVTLNDMASRLEAVAQSAIDGPQDEIGAGSGDNVSALLIEFRPLE